MYCEKYKALLTPQTCIARQRILGTNNFSDGAGHNWGQTGRNAQYDGCRGCKIGIALLKGDPVPTDEKTCTECKGTFPATLKYFDYAPRSEDRLTKLCVSCRKIQKVEKRVQEKDTQKKLDELYIKNKSSIKQEQEKIMVLKNHAKKIEHEMVQNDTCKNGAFQKSTSIPTYKCNTCGHEKFLTTDNWYVNNSNRTGYETQCKACRNISKKNQRMERQNNLYLDFSEHKSLYEKIEASARESFRTPDMQIMATIYDVFGRE